MSWFARRKDKRAARPSTGDMAEQQRALWTRAEEALAAYKNARGGQVGHARERLLRVADEVDESVRTLEHAGASERQVLMARLAAEEIRGFVTSALATHPDGGQA